MVPKLTVVFFLSLFFALCLPGLHLLAFAPFLVILYTRVELTSCLWCACGCGLLIDLLSSTLPLGCHALNYVLVTLILFRVRRIFFAHKPIALAIKTTAFSLISTALLLLMLNMNGSSVPFSWRGILSDFGLMPLLDGAYAFVCYTCPIYTYRALRKFIKKARILSHATH